MDDRDLVGAVRKARRVLGGLEAGRLTLTGLRLASGEEGEVITMTPDEAAPFLAAVGDLMRARLAAASEELLG
jgi:hypothetical protein